MEVQTALFFQKYDPRADYFDSLIGLMLECGIKDYLMRRALPYRDMKERKEYKEERLILEHFYLIYIVGMAGMTLAILAFMVEKRSRIRQLSVKALLGARSTLIIRFK